MWGDIGRYGEIWGDHDLPRREDVAPLELDRRAAHRLRGLARGHGARAHEERQEERRGHEAHLRGFFFSRPFWNPNLTLTLTRVGGVWPRLGEGRAAAAG